jgi:DNA-binding transcriptional LysR family regulator
VRHDLVSLRVFATIGDTLNLTRAAEHLHLTVSAVSKRVQELEAHAGGPLLVRQPRGVQLTAVGQTLLHHARQVLRDLDRLDEALGEHAAGLTGTVRLHAVASSLLQFLPADLGGFLAQHPRVLVQMEERTSQAVARAVADGSADLGIVSHHTPLGALQARPYRRDELVLAVPVGHVLASARALHFAEALDHVFISSPVGSALWRLMQDVARDSGRPLRTQVQVSSFDCLIRLIEAGFGIGLLPRGVLGASIDSGRLCAVPLLDVWTQRQLLLLCRDADALSAAARALMQHLDSGGFPVPQD